MNESNTTNRQSNLMSLIESAVSVLVGYVLTVMVQLFLYPLFEVRMSLQDSLLISLIVVFIAFLKNYMVRRVFNRIQA